MKEDKENIFFELARAKSEPKPLKIEVDEKPLVTENEEESEGQLTVDVYQDKDDIVVQSTIAGVNPENLEINITPESVTIRGRREKTNQVEEKDYFYQECFWGHFSRSIILPHEVDPEKSTASLKNGILTIRMPKLDRKKAKKLKVKSDLE
jgi:HSP20 family protein